jgi:hypothetical protein
VNWRVPSIALVLVLIFGAVAHAAATRAEYVAQVDPFCQAGQRDMKAEARRQKPAIKRIRDKLEQEGDTISREQEVALLGKLAAKEFSPTLKVFPRVTAQIAGVAPAPPDVTAVNQWLAARRAYSQLIARAVRAAKQGKTPTYNRLIEKATGKFIEGEIPVEGFGFRFCLLRSPQD